MPIKEEVVQFMTNIINDLNRQGAQAQGVSDDEIERAIAEHQQQLMFVNSVIYDGLVANNLIVSG